MVPEQSRRNDVARAPELVRGPVILRVGCGQNGVNPRKPTQNRRGPGNDLHQSTRTGQRSTPIDENRRKRYAVHI